MSVANPSPAPPPNPINTHTPQHTEPKLIYQDFITDSKIMITLGEAVEYWHQEHFSFIVYGCKVGIHFTKKMYHKDVLICMLYGVFWIASRNAWAYNAHYIVCYSMEENVLCIKVHWIVKNSFLDPDPFYHVVWTPCTHLCSRNAQSHSF